MSRRVILLVLAVTSPGQALVALGAAYLLGQTVDWKALWAPGPPADLPPSPWLRQSYWVVAPYQARGAERVLYELVEAVAHISLARLRPELRLVSDLGLDGQAQENFIVALKENFAEAPPNCLAGRSNPGAIAEPGFMKNFTLTAATHPFLLDHHPGGRILVPLAYAVELLARLWGTTIR